MKYLDAQQRLQSNSSGRGCVFLIIINVNDFARSKVYILNIDGKIPYLHR